MLGDNRRALEHVAGKQRFTSDECVIGDLVVCKHDLAHPAFERLALRTGLDLGEGGLIDHADCDEPQRGELNRVIHHVAVLPLVKLVELRVDDRAGIRRISGKIDGNRVLLAQIAHLDRAVEQTLRRTEALGLEQASCLLLHLSETGLGFGGVKLRQQLHVGASEVVLNICHEHAERREGSLPRRHDYFGDAELARDVDGNEATPATEGEHREVLRVVPEFDRDGSHGAHDLCVRDPDHAATELGHRDADLLGDRRERRHRLLAVERKLAAERGVDPEVTDGERCVGEGRFGATAAIGRGARHCAGALGTDLQAASLVEVAERTAASPDGVNVERRRVDGKPLELCAVVSDRGAVEHERCVEAGAPHVDRDQVRAPDELREARSADHTARGAGENQVHRLLTSGGGGHRATSRARHQELPLEAAVCEFALQRLQVAAHDRLDVGVEHCRAGALVLSVGARELVRDCHLHAWSLFQENLTHALLILRSDIGVQEGHGNGLVATPGDLTGQFPRLLLVERHRDAPIEETALGDLKRVVALEQRGRLAVLDVVHRNAVGTPEQIDVAKPAGRHSGDPRARTSKQRVQSQRAAVVEHRHLVEVCLGFAERLEHTA